MISITLPEVNAFEYLAMEVASYMVIKDNAGELFLCHLKEVTVNINGGLDSVVTQIDADNNDEILNEYFCTPQKRDESDEEKKADYLYFDKDRFNGKEEDKDAIKELNHIVKHLFNLMANAAISIEKTITLTDVFGK